MKISRRWIGSSVVAIMAVIFSCPLMSQDSDLMIAAKKLMETAGKGQAAEIVKATMLLKEAGLSYQGDLLAPRQGVIDCKDRAEQLSVLTGIYMVDVTYAFSFHKRDVAMDTFKFVLMDVTERLAVKTKMFMDPEDPVVKSRFWAGGPTSKVDSDASFAQVQADYERLIRAAETDPDLLAYLVDRFFGGAVEYIYLSCKLALGAPGGEKLIPVFNAATARIDLVLPVLDALKDRRLQASMHGTERELFLNAVMTIIQKKGGNLAADDLKGILKLVEPVRNSYIAKCK